MALVPVIDAQTAILDGEIIAKDATGRPIFLDLMRRASEASYVAFDLLWLNGEDFRRQALGVVKALKRGSPPSGHGREGLSLTEPKRGRAVVAAEG